MSMRLTLPTAPGQTLVSGGRAKIVRWFQPIYTTSSCEVVALVRGSESGGGEPGGRWRCGRCRPGGPRRL